MTYSKAPWQNIGDYDSDCYMSEIVDANGQFVCAVWTKRASRESKIVSVPEGEANARLILRASELLYTCKLLTELVNQANPGAFDNGVYDPTGTICEGEVLAARIMEDARVLIAKVKGEL